MTTNQPARMNIYQIAQRQLRRLAAPVVQRKLGKQRAAMLHYDLWCLLCGSASNDAIWAAIKNANVEIEAVLAGQVSHGA